MFRSPFDLDGRLALITGSSRGIGLALARSLAQAGARVVLNGRQPAAVEAASASLAVNLRAPFLVAQAAARSMADRGRGKIINIGSVQSQLGRPTISPSTATKGGLALLTKGLCADLGPLGLQVNCLAPGYFATELTSDLVADPDFSAWLAERTPAGRWGEVTELGGAIVFLASDASSFVNGQTIFVDGGMTAVV